MYIYIPPLSSDTSSPFSNTPLTFFTPREKRKMEPNFTTWPRRAVGRGSLPKFLVVLVLLCTVFVWMAGSLYRREETLELPSAPVVAEVSLMPKVSAYTSKPKPHLNHFWGVDVTPGHLRGEGERNRTQLGREKASLVMLVRYVGGGGADGGAGGGGGTVWLTRTTLQE